MSVLSWNFHRRQWRLLLTSIDAILLPWKLPSTSMGVIYLHGMDVGGRKPKLPWKQMEVPSFTATETSVRFYTLPSVSMEVYLLPSNAMEVSGSFHGRRWKFALTVEVEDSIASISCSFHDHNIRWKLPWASTCPYIFPPTSFRLLPQDFRKGPPPSIRSTSMEVSTNFRGSFQLPPTSTEVNWK